jgi:hypothetical protein
MRQIPLTQGYVALVDDEDYERVVRLGKWHAKTKRGVNAVYACHSGSSKVSLHGFVTGWSYVDHINGDGLDNRRANLRQATHAGNMQNQRRPKNNTSGYKGVSWHRATGKWRAYIKRDGKQVHLGIFDTPEAAAHAYDDASRELHGAFSRPNFDRSAA